MRTWAGSGSTVLFTHLSASSSNTLTGTLAEMSSGGNASSSLAGFECHAEGVMDIVQKRYSGKIDKVCLLDPKAEVELSVEDGDGKFEAFLFGVCFMAPLPWHSSCMLTVHTFRAYWGTIHLAIGLPNYVTLGSLVDALDQYK
jgi:hypothetical protein